MSEIYRQRIAVLEEGLRNADARAKVIEGVRQLVDPVMPVPENGKLGIVLRGGLAAMLSFAIGKQKPGAYSAAGLGGKFGWQGSLVARTRNQRILRLFEQPIPRVAA